MNPYSSTTQTGPRTGLLRYLAMAGIACAFQALVWFWPQAQVVQHDPVRTLRMAYMLAAYPGIAFGWWLAQKLGFWQDRMRKRSKTWHGARY